MNTREHALATAARLQQSGTAFALVTVLRAETPSSARPGDKAVVTEDGRLHGWVGGGCAQPAVLRTVRLALADGRARTIRIAVADRGEERALGDVLEFGMSCHSGGALELFVDPVCARPQLVVIGRSPVALGLSQLGPRVGFTVTCVAHEASAADFPEATQVVGSDVPEEVRLKVGAGAWIVVATQGRRDIQGLRLALALDAAQISFVASARKAGVLKEALIAAGEQSAGVAAIVAPAGYPMAAGTPEEIALSVLAAIVAQRRQRLAAAVSGPASDGAPIDGQAEPTRSARAMAAAAADSAAAARPLPGAAPDKPLSSPGCCKGGN